MYLLKMHNFREKLDTSTLISKTHLLIQYHFAILSYIGPTEIFSHQNAVSKVFVFIIYNQQRIGTILNPWYKTIQENVNQIYENMYCNSNDLIQVKQSNRNSSLQKCCNRVWNSNFVVLLTQALVGSNGNDIIPNKIIALHIITYSTIELNYLYDLY